MQQVLLYNHEKAANVPKLECLNLFDMVKNELKKNFTALAANNTLFIIGGGCEENGFNQNFYLQPKPEKSL